MKIAIVKPDLGIAGGFEFVLARVRAELERLGHAVETVEVDAGTLPATAYGLELPLRVWEHCFEFVRHVALIERFHALDLRRYDAVISSQPPSSAVAHPHHLSLFYHHLRVYYDLSELYVGAGFADPTLHGAAEAAVRRVDAAHLEEVDFFLAGSEELRGRLVAFNGISGNVGLFHAAPVAEARSSPPTAFGDALCVSRHEFSKRPELFVHAMKYLPQLDGAIVGRGGRFRWVETLDRRLSSGEIDLDSLGSRDLWLNTGAAAGPPAPAGATNVRLLGRVSARRLDELYRAALCVVAPAYREDYGLTALEAMSHGKPVIVCEDGGGLLELVEDGVNGFVVAPEGAAIAGAIRRLADDRELARTLGARGRDRSLGYSWDRAMGELRAGIERVTS